MEQREGYKKTDIGWIPEDWDVVKVKNLGDVITGSTPKTSNNEFYQNGSRLWASPADLGKNKYVKNTIKKLSPLGFEQTRKLPKNSLLITCIGSTIGKMGMAFEEMSTNQQINAIACNTGQFHYDCYYYILLRMGSKIKQMSATQAVPILNKTDFSNIAVPKIPYPEQQKIASILTTVDDKISSIDQQIQQTEQLKKGLMEKLLTEGIGHTEFKDTKIGRIPKGWGVVQIKNIGNVVTGNTPKTSNKNYYENGNRLWASPADLGNGKYVKLTVKRLSELGFNQTRILPSNSLLITCIGSTIGKIGVAVKEMSTNQQINSIVCKDGYYFDCYYYYLLKISSKIKQMSAVQAVPILNKQDFSNIFVPQMPIEEQKQIATILSTVDDKIEILNQKKIHYQTLKNGLSQQLLTGQMRVKI